ncbi:MAG: 30S ribosomal protein S20 [Gemmatimonadetes bacterium]|nr:30S ribosomal protein S20 [Gemmatimonadota bacterium]MCY3943629.1 30S ribosomal protein S20 [Gemmatimonadota bacterium]
MPNIKSATKRMHLSRAARGRNRVLRSQIRTALRRIGEAESKAEAERRRRAAVALIDRAATRRILHPNRAARLKSRMDRTIQRLA